MKTLIALFVVLLAAVACGQDPFQAVIDADHAAAEKAKADAKAEAAKRHEDNDMIPVPAELLAKISNRDWGQRISSNYGVQKSVPSSPNGKPVKLYFRGTSETGARLHRDVAPPKVLSIVVRTPAGKEVEVSTFGISQDNDKYLNLLMKQLWKPD